MIATFGSSAPSVPVYVQRLACRRIRGGVRIHADEHVGQLKECPCGLGSLSDALGPSNVQRATEPRQCIVIPPEGYVETARHFEHLRLNERLVAEALGACGRTSHQFLRCQRVALHLSRVAGFEQAHDERSGGL